MKKITLIIIFFLFTQPVLAASTFDEFQLTVQEVISDSFAGWTVGDFQVLDPLDSLFDGKTISFALNLNGAQQTIQSKPGSNIDVEVALLVFISDILQVPGDGYEFKGGSFITFKEPPKVGDTSKIIFYQGTGAVDVTNVDILETVKKGDEIKLYDQDIALDKLTCFSGEIGLSGEIRAVNRIESRIAEAEKLGYKQIIISKYNKFNTKGFNIDIVQCGKIEEVFRLLF